MAFAAAACLFARIGAVQAASPVPAPAGQSKLASVVVQATALPGGSIEADKVPGTVVTLSAQNLSRTGAANLTQALASQLGSISINESVGDRYQPDVLYRGFEASPQLGTPQGLAVYQNGVRINEAFGDTVNWDLIPDLAIERVTVVSSDPVYGLNALGGGISVQMKNGFDYTDGEASLSGGSFSQRAAALQYGTHSSTLGFYLAGRALDESGWRAFSPSRLRQLYAAFSLRTSRTSLDVSYTLANNSLDGQGSVPVQELAIARSLVFTGPQANQDRLHFVTVNGTFHATNALAVQSVLYYRQYAQDVANGNTTEYTACLTPAYVGLLCQPNASTPVTNASGSALADISDGGTVPIGENDFERIHAYGRGGALQATDNASILGRDNHLVVGVSLDYSRVGYFSGQQIGVIGPGLIVRPSSLLVDTPESSVAGLASGGVPVDLSAVNKYFGAYLTDTLEVSPALSVTVSGRYNLAKIDLEDRRGTDLSGQNRYTHFNPAIGATYKFAPTMTGYADFSQESRTPTASEIECSNPSQPCLLPTSLAGDPPRLRQVIAHTYETGLRGTLFPESSSNLSIGWNIDIFRTNLDDDIYGVSASLSRGFFSNIGATRREGLEASLTFRGPRASAYLDASDIEATFQSAFLMPSPFNPYRDANGNIHVRPGDRLPGIPQYRLKAGLDYKIRPRWSVGATLAVSSGRYFVGDASNRLPKIPGFVVVGLHSSYLIGARVKLFASVDNLFDETYATQGILGDPTGVGAPGIPPSATTNGPGVDNRFESPAAPIAVHGGIRVYF